jgi:hypothetical protein
MGDTGGIKILIQDVNITLPYFLRLGMILWQISTAISIKCRILATFSMKERFNSDSLYAFKGK